MKKTIVAAFAAAMALLTGCEPNEQLLVMGANTAGNLALSTWFAIDDPDCDVKETLKEVVKMVTDASVNVGEGATYLDAVLPGIQELVAKRDKLTPAQKNLINTGSVVILNGVDAFIASKPEIKTNLELANKVVAAFGKGCLTALSLTDNCSESQSIKKAHAAKTMSYKVEARAFVK